MYFNQNGLYQNNMAEINNRHNQKINNNNYGEDNNTNLVNLSSDVTNNTQPSDVPQIPRQSEVIVNNVPQFEITLKEAKDRIQQLQEFIKYMMVPNIDYGFIPNCPKPTLFKAGAEKLCDVYGFSKIIDIINRIEDFDKGLFHYEIKITLVNKRTGIIEAEGVGCCNNKEKKYINQDPFSISNTILKMAKKRALVDAVLSATRTSGIFSQDLENINQNRAV
ncbi:MAG: hypothetical protein PHC56_05790 [Herbinix sp.]|nr:hypothetical protein [Herbinix sp.]